MRNSKVFWLLSLVLVLSAFLAACGGGEDTSTEPSDSEGDKEKESASGEMDSVQELNLMESAEIPTMDSALAEDAVAFNIMNNVNEGLYRLNQENVAEPAVAEGEPEISEDGLTYTFKLRDAKWSDGSPVTAQDFVFSWQRAVDPATGSPYGPYMMAGTIKNAAAISEGKMDKAELGVEAKDEKTLVVTLERPVPYFMSLMAFGTFLPQKEAFVTEKGDAYASNSENLLYNGPFTLTNWDGTGLTWTMEKNPEYWDAETVKLDKINVDVVKESGTGVNLYTSGEKDRAGLSGEYAMQYADDPEVVRELEPTVFYLKFNQERNGKETPLANVNIRKAISMAYNKQDLVDVVLANGSLPADFLVPTEFTFDESKKDFREVNGKMNEFNAEEAKKLWETGLKELGVTEVTLEMLGGDSELAKKMDEYMKSQLEGNLEGLTINLKAVPFAVRLELDEKQDYDIQNSGWGPDYQDPMTFLDLFVTGSAQNKMGYSNPEFDKLIEQAKGELAQDIPARWEAMAKAEKILIEDDAAIAGIYQRGIMSLQKPYVHDIVVHPFGGDFSYKWAYISGKE
ncbi:peptide ABC transporter substrate-binding protein [Planococcus glaciei]|uniref:Peptide ABC transporter substrate-binding protein n=1 Tax=Planococcus glaciei TaxID=459472 RepID=A0A1G8EZ57_9BACL|nr:peptide ABC transporter substrate-binding protein [Planococcus glaciei]ETP69485.1 peptide ABC transporter substrate-binding protein [Planococcus glaciei CHR43]KOF11470.1 peptide ABC transporter substrate-binding protein [Planococcus glaciei]MBX0313539.1 peptide ABC transporter substrate-binding protein [Planococcus glaciei]QKX49310.1 peptide ABC transporter substrate-binding protein [Planococcus glaciei]SDH75198.1 oligopeptide transport system substrate-binding protein [Planococcus glaciei]